KEGANPGENGLLIVESDQLVGPRRYSRRKSYLVSAVRRGLRVGKPRIGVARETIESQQRAVRLCLVLIVGGRSCVFGSPGIPTYRPCPATDRGWGYCHPASTGP